MNIRLIKFLFKDNNWRNEITCYWFDVNGVEYAISDRNGYLQMLDESGSVIPEDYINEALFEALCAVIHNYA